MERGEAHNEVHEEPHVLILEHHGMFFAQEGNNVRRKAFVDALFAAPGASIKRCNGMGEIGGISLEKAA